MSSSDSSNKSNESLKFKSILSDKTHYGVIWNGIYENHKCVIKVVVLNTGIHYDKQSDKYYDAKKKISKKSAIKAFSQDDHIPYLHTRYIKKKAMDIKTFHHEVKMIKEVAKLRLAPELYDSWVDNTTSKIHYGIIVMRKLSMTVKDIILERDLTSAELNYLKDKIHKLHNYGIKHGDLKPSNIGIDCDKTGKIRRFRIIDWAKGQYTKDDDLFKRDLRTFHAHIKKNIKER